MTRALGRCGFVVGLSAAVFAAAVARAQADAIRVIVDYENDGRPIAPEAVPRW